jgi:hypothetical protein
MRKLFLSMGHFAPPIDFWLDLPLDETFEWCEVLNELLDPNA